MNNSGKYTLWVIVLAILSLAGLGAWLYQISTGLIVTGMRNVVSWGLYITSFMFLVGLSAGGLIVSSSASVFNVKEFKPVSKPAVLLSAVCIILAALFILVDLGQPMRILNLLIHPQFNSPLMWDVIVIAAYLITSVVYLYYMNKQGDNTKNLAIVSGFALPIAILVHSVTAWIFGLQIARPVWHSALLAPLFVASALASGLALLIVVLAVLNKYGTFKTEKGLFKTLGGLLATFVAVDLFFVFSEVLTATYPGEERLMAYITMLISGEMTPFFWGEIVIGIAIPFLLLIFKRDNPVMVVISSVLVVIGTFCMRVWLLFTALLLPLIDWAPGITKGEYVMPNFASGIVPNVWVQAGAYAPSLVELVIFVGIFAFGALLYTLGAKAWLTEGEKSAPAQKGTSVAS